MDGLTGLPYFTGLDFKGRRAVVMGLGRFGGGVGVARFLAQAGARVLVTDRARPETLAAGIAALEGLGIETRLGEHREEDILGAELLVLSPAVDPRSPLVRAAAAAGARIDTEINILVRLLAIAGLRTVGVTGSAGKSTTAALTAEGLRAHDPDALLGGNIGGSLLERVAEGAPTASWAVLELSSFMLEHLDGLAWSPDVAVVTGLSQDHLERHGGWAGYVAAKRTIARHQSARDALVLNGADPALAGWRGAGATWTFGRPDADRGAWVRDGRIVVRLGGLDQEILEIRSLRLPGEHNRWNALAALCACAACAAEPRAAAARIAEFRGLPHRLEDLGEAAGVRWLNDSKATGPGEGSCGIAALAERGEPFVLLAGGRIKDGDYSAWAGSAAGAEVIVLFGEGRDRLARLLAEAGRDTRVAVVPGVRDAVAEAATRPGEAKTVLFSPACTSYDAYSNYEERGEDFRRAVREMKYER